MCNPNNNVEPPMKKQTKKIDYYVLKDSDIITISGKQLRDWKKKIEKETLKDIEKMTDETIRRLERKRILKIIERKINDYLKKQKKTLISVNKEWKEKKNYPMYSNQYYAFKELQSFWEELKQELGDKSS